MRCILSVLTCLALALSAAASSSRALGRQPQLSARQSADTRLRVQTESGKTQFQMGEVIQLRLSFTSSATKKYQINMASYDRSGRMNHEKFLVEPEGATSDPLRSYFIHGGFIGGGITGFQFLSEEPSVISLDLNEWVRFDRPGKYSLRIVSHRVGELQGDKSYADRSLELVSNELQLTIVPAQKSWQEATLKKATAVLDEPKAADNKAAALQIKNREAALKTLRYLGSAEAVRELARRFRGEDPQTDFTCTFGLVGSPHRDLALGEMQRLLADPNHPVSSTFLYALNVLMRNPEQSQEKLAEDDKKNREMIQNELLGAVSQKRGKALALTLNTILETSGFDGREPGPVSAQMVSQIAAVFDQLPLEKQTQILHYNWEMIKSPLFLPILRRYALAYKDFPVPNEENAYNSLRLSGAALLHWYEMAPQEAREVIIREIMRPKPRYGAHILGVLPDETLPEAEQALAENFIKQRGDYPAENLASLLHRYATDSVLPQILPVVDEQVGRWACAIQTPILAYLLRVNPDIARPRIEAALAARGKEYSACNRSLLVELGDLQQSPLLEEIAVRSLVDDDPEVAGNAASFLGRYGSPAAEEMLWKRLSLWNEKWRGREKEFRYVPGERNANLAHGQLGSNLIMALATGKSWVADANKLRRLRQLAIGQDIQQLDSMMSGWEQEKTYTVFYFSTGRELRFRVMQYELDSLKSLEEKLAQFPQGSTFMWSGTGSTDAEDEKMFRELSQSLTGRGMKLSRPQNQQ